MTRLKYYNTLGILHTDWFTIGPNFIVRGTINSDNKYVSVYEFDGKVVYDGGQATNLRQAKDKLKKKLIEIGVNFDGEIRNK